MKKVFIFIVSALSILIEGDIFADEIYSISMFPGYSCEQTGNRISPLAGYLSRKTGTTVKPVIFSDYSIYTNRLINGTIAIGYEDSVVYVAASDSHEVIATAVNGESGDKLRGIIIAGPDSGIESINDLRKKKIMILGQNSAGGYLSQKMTLLENGIDVERDCEIELSSDNNQENVIISVSIGDVDAGFIYESAIDSANKYVKPGSIKVVAYCAWLPNWAFSVKRSLPEETKEAIKNALFELKKGAPELKAINVDQFRSASDSDYDIIRNLLERKTIQRESLKKLIGNNQRLTIDNQRLTIDNKKLISDNKKLDMDNQKLVINNQKLDMNNKKLTIDNKKLISDNQNLVGDNKKLDTDNQNLVGDNKKLDTDNQKLIMNIEKLTVDIKKLNMDNRKLIMDNEKPDPDINNQKLSTE